MLFQSTRPRGVRRCVSFGPRIGIVSIHAPARGATNPVYLAGCNPGFNPRARAGCDDLSPRLAHYSLFQSTRPRGVRRVYLVIGAAFRVSIHAPARGATDSDTALSFALRFNPRARAGCDSISARASRTIRVSIHAPARGATEATSFRRSISSFNPRARAGCDPTRSKRILPWPVSIHAPARGATRQARPDQDGQGFNPRARAGCDCSAPARPGL